MMGALRSFFSVTCGVFRRNPYLHEIVCLSGDPIIAVMSVSHIRTRVPEAVDVDDV